MTRCSMFCRGCPASSAFARAIGAAGDPGFPWNLDNEPTSRTLPDRSTAIIARDYAARVITDRVRNTRWTKIWFDGLGRTVKVQTGYR